ncbi:MAG: dUTP diphosphatase [Gammaproteobacteria bacterium]|nr:dUTP diphosphatase [Gammaproteobacteria bacterium]
MRERLAAKAITMLALQDEMNSRVDPDWITREREWYRAIWIECAELMDHYGGWKWWKASIKDVEQVMLEVVDIWHFGLSMRISADRKHASAAVQIADEWLRPLASRGFLRDVETLAATALSEQVFLVSAVPTLLADIGRGFDDLYRSYVGKNVLNFFRQDHGYKDGTYRKTWHGQEDNEHLVEIVTALDADSATFRRDVYAALESRYATVTTA